MRNDFLAIQEVLSLTDLTSRLEKSMESHGIEVQLLPSRLLKARRMFVPLKHGKLVCMSVLTRSNRNKVI